MSNFSDPIIFGKDPTENIVAVSKVGGWDSSVIRVWYRDGENVRHEDEKFYPYFHTSDIDTVRKLAAGKYKELKLEGDNHYDHIVVFPDWGTYWDTVKAMRYYADPYSEKPKDPDYLYATHSAEQQYLSQTGKTLFKGMQFSDIRRMQLDIETYSLGGFPNAERESDKITIISLTDSTGWEKVLHLECGVEVENGISFPDEGRMLIALVDIIQERDPDVIETHNGFMFDFPYIMKRCEMWSVDFGIGRDGSEPRTYESTRKFAERQVDFDMIDCTGRHLIDTYFLVMDFDVFKRDMPSHGLKAAAKYFGVAREGRVYVEGDQIPKVWDEDPAQLLEYALDDTRETRAIADRLSGSSFYLTQILPMNYQRADFAGNASKIESIFTREYLRRRHSLPKASEGKQQHGGYTDVFFRGVFGPVVYADVSSLYPSIMLNYDIEPKGKDHLGVFQYTLSSLTDLRLDAKGKLQEYNKDSQEYMEIDARQNSYKQVINSFYGAMGFKFFIFNHFGEADRVALTGQNILRQMIEEIESDGGKVIECDTDGVLFVPDGKLDTLDKQKAYVRSLTERMPEGIEIDHDGTYEKMVSYKKKNYVLLDGGKVKFKGSSIVSRAYEKFASEFIKEGFRCVLFEDIEGLRKCYVDTLNKIRNHDWDGIEEFMTTSTLHDTLPNYQVAVELGPGNGGRNRDAAYELALKQPDKQFGVGDRVSYYVSGPLQVSKIRVFEHAKLVEEWDPKDPDDNPTYYEKKRLREIKKKFKPFFSEADYDRIFGEPNGLFEVDLSQSEIIATKLK